MKKQMRTGWNGNALRAAVLGGGLASLVLLGSTPSSHALPSAVTSAPITAAPATSQSTTDAASSSLSQQLASLRVGGKGLSLTSISNASPDTLVAGTDSTFPNKTAKPAVESPWSFFLSPTGTFGTVDPGVSAQQANFYGFGVLGGVNYQLTQEIGVGAYAGYDHTKTEYHNTIASGEDNATRLGLFASWSGRSNDWVTATVGGAFHDMQSDRYLSGGSNIGDTQGLEFDSTLKYGHDFHSGAWTLTPTLGLDYIRLAVDGYDESGPNAISYGNQNTNSLRSELGATFAYTVKDGNVKWMPYVQGGWNHQFLDDVATTQAALVGGGTVALNNQAIGRETATAGAGVNATFSETYSATLGYEGELNSYYQSHSFQASVNVAF